MKVAIAYPVPCDSQETWDRFKPFVQRFINTWNKFPPGIRVQVSFVVCGNWFYEFQMMSLKMMPDPTSYHLVYYPGNGCDFGAQQFLSWRHQENTFQVNFTTRAYFHRAGWMARLVAARNLYGPGLYGMSCAKEGGKFHLCTRGFAYDTDDYALYPTEIVSRDQGVFMECGDGCLLDFFHGIGREAHIVYWDKVGRCDEKAMDWPNSYRNGNQEQMLVWDKHTQAYADADEKEKSRLRWIQKGEPEL
jgi:hypothetical protein